MHKGWYIGVCYTINDSKKIETTSVSINIILIKGRSIVLEQLLRPDQLWRWAELPNRLDFSFLVCEWG